jgi:hypothetical protein
LFFLIILLAKNLELQVVWGSSADNTQAVGMGRTCASAAAATTIIHLFVPSQMLDLRKK